MKNSKMTQLIACVSLAFVLPFATTASAGQFMNCTMSGGDGGSCGCAQEKIESNVALVDQKLLSIIATPDFVRAEDFKKIILRLTSERDLTKKIRGYMALVGVNPSSKDEMLQFLGARDLGPYISVFEHKANLAPDQSKIVVEALVTSLRANLARPK